MSDRITVIPDDKWVQTTGPVLRFIVRDFVDAATKLGITGLRQREEGSDVIVSTPDPEAMVREYGLSGGQPDSWVSQTVREIGGHLS